MKLKEDYIRSEENTKSLEKQILGLKDQISTLEDEIVKQKVQNGFVEKERDDLNRNIQSHQIDKDLMQQQVEFYQQEIEKYKRKIAEKDMCFESLMNTLQGS